MLTNSRAIYVQFAQHQFLWLFWMEPSPSIKLVTLWFKLLFDMQSTKWLEPALFSAGFPRQPYSKCKQVGRQRHGTTSCPAAERTAWRNMEALLDGLDKASERRDLHIYYISLLIQDFSIWGCLLPPLWTVIIRYQRLDKGKAVSETIGQHVLAWRWIWLRVVIAKSDIMENVIETCF